MNNLTTFYIVRHAEAESNIYEYTNKPFIDFGELGTDLTDKGVQQAADRAKELSHIHFDAVFSSDFIRAQKTAEIIAKDRNLAVQTTKLIRERKWGNVVGQQAHDIQQQMDELQKGLSDEEKMQVKVAPDMETEEEAVTRFIRFIREAAVAYPGKTILLVSHGTVMRRFLVKIGFTTYDEIPGGSIQNTGYIKLESDGIDFFVKETKGVTKKTIKKYD